MMILVILKGGVIIVKIVICDEDYILDEWAEAQTIHMFRL